jgi:hypothetical protein
MLIFTKVAITVYRMMGRKIISYILVIIGTMFLVQSCSTGKKGCGCGNDINRAFKSPKKYH